MIQRTFIWVYDISNGCLSINCTSICIADEEFQREYISNIKNAMNEEEIPVLPKASSPDDNFKWNENVVKLLLELYQSELENFRNPKAKKNILWIKIAQKLIDFGYSVTPDMCDKKFRNLKITFKTIRDKMKKTGRARQHWAYFNTMEEIFKTDSTVNPPCLIASLKPTSVIPECTTSTEATTTLSFERINEPQPSTSHTSFAAENLTAIIPEAAAAETSTETDEKIRTHPATKSKKNRELQQYRKKMFELEEEKVKVLKEINDSYHNIAQSIKERNNLLKEYLKK